MIGSSSWRESLRRHRQLVAPIVTNTSPKDEGTSHQRTEPRQIAIGSIEWAGNELLTRQSVGESLSQ